ncbi:MAG: hypothetical protein ACYS26_11775 [Planctomycetota bacterium]
MDSQDKQATNSSPDSRGPAPSRTLLLAGVGLGLALAVFLAWKVFIGGRTPSSEDLKRFSDRAGLVIPPTAEAPAFREDLLSLHDPKMYLRLEMPKADLASFLTRSKIDGELYNTERTEPATRYLGGFLPRHPENFMEGQKSLAGGALNVLVDLDSPEKAVVYLLCFDI